MGDTINQKIFIWARGQVGKQIGDGECWTMADRALRQAGARSSSTQGKNDDYEWGDPISLKDIQPGDILQFRDYVVVTTTETEASAPDGWGGAGEDHDRRVRGHHTAIVDAILGPNEIRILEQHVKPLGPKVQVHTIPLRGATLLPKTTYEDFHEGRRVHRGTKVTRTVRIAISGSLWAYRPKSSQSR
jgi:hypothetical protein